MVDSTVPHQVVDGFGVSPPGYTRNMTPDQAARFLQSTSGLGLSLWNITVIARK
jgi:hypothetical protein